MRSSLLLCLSAVLLIGAAAPAGSPPIILSPKRVVAEKGPIRLTFEVANTKVGKRDSLWVRLTLTNIGRTPLEVNDEVFEDIRAAADGVNTIRIEVVDSRGKELLRDKPDDVIWDEELAECLNREFPKGKSAPPIPRTLAPGESISTRPEPSPSAQAYSLCLHDPALRSFPPYGEINGWRWTARRYRVRAVYRHEVPAKLLKHLTDKGRLDLPACVNFHTGWIPIEVGK